MYACLNVCMYASQCEQKCGTGVDGGMRIRVKGCVREESAHDLLE